MRFYKRYFLLLFFFVFLSIYFFESITSAAPANIVNARGMGDAEKTALDDAKKNAVSQACGETFLSSTEQQSEINKTKNINTNEDSTKSLKVNSKVSDQNMSLVGASIKSYKISNKGKDNDLFFVEIQAVIGECKKSEVIQNAIIGKNILDELKKVSSEIKALNNTGGLIPQPTTFAQIYHNARIYTQSGEVDQAIKLYENLLNFPILMADPITDMVTLAKRNYGLAGAQTYFEKIKSKMPKPLYLYAQLLMIEPGYESKLNLKKIVSTKDWIDASNIFPPLAYQILIQKKPYKSRYHDYTWTEWKMYFDLNKKVRTSINNGEFLSYYIDQIRAGTQLETYSREKIAPWFDDLFVFVLPNPGFPSKKFTSYEKTHNEINEYRMVELEKSPVIIDYTFYAKNPPIGPMAGGFKGEFIYKIDFNMMYFTHNLKRENELIRLQVWDKSIDPNSPFVICAIKEGKESCVNLNTSNYNKCNFKVFNEEFRDFVERYKCFTLTQGHGDVSKDSYSTFPNADATFSTKEWLGSDCISKVSYIEGDGTPVNISYKDIIATFRWPKTHNNSELIQKISKCGYDLQSDKISVNWMPYANSY